MIKEFLEFNTESITTMKNPMKVYREKCEIQKLFNNSVGMFEYEKLPDTMEGRYIELTLLKYGMVGIGNIDGKPYSVIATPMGNMSAYNIGTELTGACPLGTIQGTIGKDVVLGFNNALGCPDDYIYWLAHLLEQTDFSMEMNIKYSRNKPMPIAKTSKQKQVIDTALKNLDSSEDTTIVSEDALAEELGNEQIPVLNLTDVKNADKMQYLSSLYDDIMRRYYNRNGLGVQSKNKQAQVNSDELHAMDSNAWVEPLEKLYYRQKMVNEINDIFNQNISVHFGNVWAKEYENYLRSLTEPAAGPTAVDKGNSSADESADESADDEKGGEE